MERETPFATRVFKPYLNEKWIGNAVSYGCYRKGQAPGYRGPGTTEILEDITIIINYWNLIRVYGADNDTERILQMIQEHDLPVKVMVGVWLENEENHPEQKSANIDQVMRGIELANRYSDIVAAVSVGNETQVFWSAHKMNPENLIRAIFAQFETIPQYLSQQQMIIISGISRKAGK